MQSLIRSKSAGVTGGRGTAGAGPGRDLLYHLGHMDRVAATMPSQAHAGAAQEAPDVGQWEGQDVPLVRPSSCNVKGGIPSSRRYLPTYLKEQGISIQVLFALYAVCTLLVSC